jgi:hypothetical protein
MLEEYRENPELGFATLANWGRAMMNRANILLIFCYKVFKEAFKTSKLVDGLMAISIDGKVATRYTHLFGLDSKCSDYLQTWDEAGTVKVKTKATPKIADRGIQCMFVGYAINHAGDTYQMWDPTTS